MGISLIPAREKAEYDRDEFIVPELAEYYRQVQEACTGIGADGFFVGTDEMVSKSNYSG